MTSDKLVAAEAQDPTSLRHAIPRDILLAEVHAWARRIGVEDRLREIHIRPMKRKWASISTRGRLTLSEDLLVQPPAFRREVIVHELVHAKLGHGSHNKLFRALVRAYLADSAVAGSTVEDPAVRVRSGTWVSRDDASP